MTSDELRALADAATPGPWHEGGWDSDDPGHWIHGGGPSGSQRERGIAVTFVLPTETKRSPEPKANAALIALVPDAARLLADAMDYVAHMEKHWGKGIAGSGALLARFAALRTNT